MMGHLGFAIIGSFLWGLISVLLSPCHLASIPLMIGYVAGQHKLVEGKEAVGYAGLFSLGLFISIGIVGSLCWVLGRILGDVSPYFFIPVGVLFVILGLDLMGVSACRLPSFSKGKLFLRGYIGALVLGLSYGIISGACTFGFIAPILAIISVQQQVMHGIILLFVFALGHCLPIAIAGSSVALAQRLLSSKSMQVATTWGRKLAGVLVVGVGIYVILTPFFA